MKQTYLLIFIVLAALTIHPKHSTNSRKKGAGLILTPSSVYNGGFLQENSLPFLAGYFQKTFSQIGYKVLPQLTASAGDTITAVALQPDNKILLAGYSNAGQSRYSITRLNTDGSLDTSFNPTGTLPGTSILPNFTGSTGNQANALAVQANGKIVLGGYSTVAGVDRYSIARLNTDGSLDATFNPTGALPGTLILPTFTGSTTNQAKGIALQSDGKIVLAGYSNTGQFRYSVARLNTDGSLDTSFNPTGALKGTFILPIFTLSTEDQATGVALQQNGKIILGGYSIVIQSKYSVATLNPDGSLDETFNAASALAGTYILPTFTASTNDKAQAIILQTDGKIILAGFSTTGAFRYSITRLTSQGILDSSFHTTGALPGTYILPTFTGSNRSQAFCITLQPDNKIVLAGYSRVAATERYSIARLTSDGFLDNSFSPNGNGFLILPTFNTATQNRASGIALQSNGSIILGGFSTIVQTFFSAACLTNNYTLTTYQDQYPNKGGFY